MKPCINSSNCPYGSAFEKNVCAYDMNLTEHDFCPSAYKEWEYIINKITKEENTKKNDLK